MRVLCNDSLIDKTFVTVEIVCAYYESDIYDGVYGIVFHCLDGDICFIRGISCVECNTILCHLFDDGCYSFLRFGELEYYDED